MTFVSSTVVAVERHLADLDAALVELRAAAPEVARWARDLCSLFTRGRTAPGGRNGGSAALASHLTGELVGRFLEDRRPLSALWLGADQSALTAIVNDYGPEAAFARQVEAHAGPGDVVLLLSSSGRSPNLLAAASAALHRGAECWAMTGSPPNPLATMSDRVLAVTGTTAVVQEAQQVLVPLVVRRARRPAGERMRAVRRVVVVGDSLVDRDWHGDATRLCPDSAAPVVDLCEESVRPGGAALAAVAAARRVPATSRS